MTSTTRRTFLRGAAGVGSATLMPKLGWAAAGAPDYLAAAGLPDGGFCLVGLTGDGLECFRLPLPDRGHAAAAHPARPEAVAFARRPGTFALVIDCAEGREVARLHSPEDRHFYGHGAFTPDGSLLFTTENAIAEGTGRLGIWDADAGYRRIGEVPTGGTGPHEVRLMPDGRRFAVANGGIETDPTSGRAELNLATMRSNLAYLDAASGEVVEVLELPEAAAAELAAPHRRRARRDARRGAAVAGLRARASAAPCRAPARRARPRDAVGGAAGAAAGAQLRRQRRGQRRRPAGGDHRAARQPDARLRPRGAGGVEVVEATDICGVAAAAAGFACSTGEGVFLTAGRAAAAGDAVRFERLAFDNHLVRI